MERLSEAERGRIVKAYVGGRTPKEIADATGTPHDKVKHVIAEQRKKLGVEAVPYISDRSKYRPKGSLAEPRVTKALESDEPPTWAGAFKVLARRLRDTGDEEGWEMAKRIAMRKGMNTL